MVGFLKKPLSFKFFKEEYMKYDDFYARKTTPFDGQGVVDLSVGAKWALLLGTINKLEFDYIIERYDKMTKLKHFYETMNNDRKFSHIFKKISKVVQLRERTNGVKGTVIVAPLKLFYKICGIEDGPTIILPKSLTKYGDKDWSDPDLEICAWLKPKSGWASLNVQFINSLTNYDDPTFLKPLVDYHHNKVMATLSSDLDKLVYHNIRGMMDDTEDNELRLSIALRNNISLKNERYINKLAMRQYMKTYDELVTGRPKIEGVYSYQCGDVINFFNRVFGVTLPIPELTTGEYWCNGKTCQAGLFRSPLISPFEAQKVDLISHEFYDIWFKDVIIFNSYDGIWELMGGSDFDGDICLCCPSDTEMGKIVVDTIEDFDYVMLHESKSAQYVKFNPETIWEDMAEYDSKNSNPDRTGLITNYATKHLEMYHHLKGIMYYAKRNGCMGFDFVHPAKLSRDSFGNPSNFNPHSEIIDGEKRFMVKGLAFAEAESDFKKWNDIFVGKKSFEEVSTLMYKFLLANLGLNPTQGDEIDGAKTGYYPEIFKWMVILLKSTQSIIRDEIIGKPISKTTRFNSYTSYAPIAIMATYAQKKREEFLEAVNDIVSDKLAMLLNLLTDDERRGLNSIVINKGNTMSLIDYIRERRDVFGNMKHDILVDKGLSSDEKKAKLSAITDGVDILQNGTLVHYKGEKEKLISIANSIGISEEIMAVACYVATNSKNNHNNENLAYAWMLFDQLISVFARGNEQVGMYKVPTYAEEVKVKDNCLYVNDCKFANVQAVDQIAVLKEIDGKRYALVKKNTSTKTVGIAESNDCYTIGALAGFKFNNESLETFKEKLLKANNTVDIDYDSDKNVVILIDGKQCCRALSNKNSISIGDLVGHSVKLLKYEECDNSIKNLTVRVIG